MSKAIRIFLCLTVMMIAAPFILVGAWFTVILTPIILALSLLPFFPALLSLGFSHIRQRSYSRLSALNNVLIVDDDEVSVLPLLEILNTMGSSVNFVNSGREMIESLAEKKYDMIFLDSSMPEMSGEEALMEADREKSNPDDTRSNVIFFTATKNIQIPTNLTNFRVVDIWSKLDPNVLANKINGAFTNTYLMT
mgnify:FL=1